jgi:hypothetical protein
MAALNDHDVLRRFEDGAVRFHEWTHRAPIEVAYGYVRQNDFNTTVASMRRGDQADNAVHPVPESDTSGSKETTTCAMMHIVAASLAAYEHVLLADDADAFGAAHRQFLPRLHSLNSL